VIIQKVALRKIWSVPTSMTNESSAQGFHGFQKRDRASFMRSHLQILQNFTTLFEKHVQD